MTVMWEDCDRKAVLQEMMDEPELSFDTETTGLDETDRAFLVTISWGEKTLCIEPRDLNDILPVFEDRTKTWHAQNAKFDMRMLENEGVVISGKISELNVMARLVRNDHQKYSLDAQAKRAGLEKLNAVAEEIKKNKLYETRINRLGEKMKVPRFDQVDRELLKVYAAHDAYITYQMAQMYKKEFTEIDGNHWRVWHNEVELTKVCYQMERRGVRIDVPKVLATREAELKRRRDLIAKFKEMTGVEFVDSAKALEQVFVSRGFTLHTTEKGNPSFTAEVLETYEDPLAELVLDIRGAGKLVSTYYDNFINLYHTEFGQHIIHPQMWPGGTRTGRFSYSEPNFQNVPRDEDIKPGDTTVAVRECIIPKEGNGFLAVDFKQQEYRVMLDYANETKLIKEVMDGADVHQATADMVGIKRQEAKTLNFACLYGAGSQQLAKMLKIRPHEAVQLKEQYFGRLPRVERFIDAVISKGRGRGFIYNWFGRRLFAESQFAYALPNHLIQSSCADVVKVAMVRLGEECPMVLQIHDELLFEVPLSGRDILFERAKEVMENVYPSMNGMKLLVDAKWSSKSFAKKDMEDFA